jgi:hypothetical protein
MFRSFFFSGLDVRRPVFQSNPAGIPIAADVTINKTIVQEKPVYAMPMPAAALPMAVANQIIALFLVASRPSRFGDR